jgi:uncharacterized DUF497 family protein
MKLSNLEKHGFDFIGAASVFEGFHITREDAKEHYGEQRFQTLGLYGNVVVVMMVHTPRDQCDHVISIRKASKHEQKYYWQCCPN